MRALPCGAQAHEGVGETAAAVKALASLVRAEPQNREARQMWQRLKEQQASERGFFGGTAAGLEQMPSTRPEDRALPSAARAISRLRPLLHRPERS